MNAFVEALRSGKPQIGLWQVLANAYTAEICARSGYDWLLFDGEHAPNTLQTLVAQLQAVAPFAAHPIARVPSSDPVAIKQYLDIGFATLLAPMVESAEQACGIVAATRFPPLGVRGVAGSTSRASGFGSDRTYLATAHERTAVVVQIESRRGLAAIEAIAAVDGVEGLFIGPGDLAAALGHLGDPRHPDVHAAISDAVARIVGNGKPCGIYALDAADAARWIARGVSFVSVGADSGLLAGGAKALRAQF